MSRMTLLDVTLGVAAHAVRATRDVARRAGPVVQPAVRLALRPPLLPETLQPERWLADLADEGAQRRAQLARALSARLDALVPVLLDEVLRRAQLTELIQRHVDIDGLVAGVDLDAAAARLDVDAVVERADIDAIVDRVDLGTLVQAVLDRLDLIALAEEVIDGVDLPELIRESTGSMASDTVRGARMQGIAADEAVGRAVDRFLRRRGRRATEVPSHTPPAEEPDAHVVPPQRQPGR